MIPFIAFQVGGLIAWDDQMIRATGKPLGAVGSVEAARKQAAEYRSAGYFVVPMHMEVPEDGIIVQSINGSPVGMANPHLLSGKPRPTSFSTRSNVVKNYLGRETSSTLLIDWRSDVASQLAELNSAGLVGNIDSANVQKDPEIWLAKTHAGSRTERIEWLRKIGAL